MKFMLRFVSMFLVGSVIFIGLPLLGWGILQISLFFDNTARTAYIVTAAFLQLFAALYLPPTARTKENPMGAKARHKIDVILLQIISLAIVLVAPYSDRHSFGTFDPGDTTRCVGLIPLVLGFVLMLVAEKHLGRYFSVDASLKEDHTLITSGPYRFIRHPRYLGVVAFFLGVSVIFRSYLAVILVGVLSIVLIWRVAVEESMLRQEFGAEWDEYCARSWRMIPFLF